MKQVLAFFGAFNPPTVAHIRLGQYAMEKTGREGVLYIPSKSDYIEEDQKKSFAFDDRERVAMLEAVAAKTPWMEVIDREIRMERQPRTYETLRWLAEKGYAPALLMGSDKLPELQHGWKYVEEIVREFGIVCMCRGQDDAQAMIREDAYLRRLSYGISVLNTPQEWKMISSSEVRGILQQIQELYEQLSERVPREVAERIIHGTQL